MSDICVILSMDFEDVIGLAFAIIWCVMCWAVLSIVVEAIQRWLDEKRRYGEYRDRLDNWLHEEEPLHRRSGDNPNMPGYPPDWRERTNYIYEKFDGVCQKCGYTSRWKRPRPWPHTRSGMHVHHIRKISNGGSHSIDNLILLCYECHRRQHPDHYF